MKLETERLILKEVNEMHTEDILRIRSNDLINHYVKRKSPVSNYDALEFILHIKRKTRDNEMIFWGISYKDQQDLIGTICLWNFSEDRKIAETGYELLPEHHKKGIMSEALASVLHFGLNALHLQEILAFTHKCNKASQALLLKHRFVLEENRTDEKNLENAVFSLKKMG
ncbi:GNAT family N-acetyltransferase [Chryseobacterium gallinarum]|uniref:GNAT family N-acetyltransferase n=1 Tax=Chryseobacterium gallinarum TaxID=1324352 RepID=UPI00202408B5|nr:GNAT family N-acetyltransferase [Chryseobacterium gallinarum]MCL8538768.1 GNAT family N-acetyltransferase [Chryseobacterium gallinarum]